MVYTYEFIEKFTMDNNGKSKWNFTSPYFTTPPSCPSLSWGQNIRHDLQYPSTSLLLAISAILALLFSLLVSIRFNSVKVFNRKIRTQNISNSMWVLFYIAVLFRGLCSSIDYGLNPALIAKANTGIDRQAIIDGVMFVVPLLMHALVTLALSLALNHQRKYRSAVPAASIANSRNSPSSSTTTSPTSDISSFNPHRIGDPKLGHGSMDNTNLLIPTPIENQPFSNKNYSQQRKLNEGNAERKITMQTIKEAIFSIDSLLLFLFAVNLFALYAQISNLGISTIPTLRDRKLFAILYLVSFAIQRIPIIIITLVIIVTHRSTNDGPTRQSRVILFIATILYLFSEIPIPVWSYILPSSCVFAVASWVDFMQVIYIISIILYFVFIRGEFSRNMEETIWSTVSQIQDTFDFRRFH